MCERGIQGGGANGAKEALCYVLLLLFFVDISPIKHQKFGALVLPQAKGGRGSRQLWPPVLRPWLDLLILIEEIPTLVSTH